MQYQERSVAQVSVSHPATSEVQEIRPRVTQPSVEVPHMDVVQLSNTYMQQQALYMGCNTTEMQLRQASGHIGPSATDAGRQEMASDHMHSATSMHSCSQMHQGEMIYH